METRTIVLPPITLRYIRVRKGGRRSKLTGIRLSRSEFVGWYSTRNCVENYKSPKPLMPLHCSVILRLLSSDNIEDLPQGTRDGYYAAVILFLHQEALWNTNQRQQLSDDDDKHLIISVSRSLPFLLSVKSLACNCSLRHRADRKARDTIGLL